MAKKNLPLLEAVPITGWAAKGRSLAKVDGMVVFVSGAVPGDVADLQLTRRKKNYAEARMERLVTPSPERETPFCKHFGICGGCTWQHLSYPAQLAFKRLEVVENLGRIGGLELPEVAPTLPSPQPRFYRNKLEYTFAAQRWFTSEELDSGLPITNRKAVGYHLPGRFDKVLDISECWLQPEPSDAIRNFIRAYGEKHGSDYYQVRAHEGWLRTLTIRTTTTGESMVILAFGHEDREQREALMNALLAEFPALTSLMWCINPKRNDTIWDLDMEVFHGRDHIIEELQDEGFPPLRFRIGPKSFFQTNPRQTVAMYEIVRQLAGLKGDELVYDLYCGAGSISLFLARHCGRVVGAEIVPEAVADARGNAELNGVTNTVFEAGDLKELLDDAFVERHGRPDVLITDPPRAGMHQTVVERIHKLAPPRIVYVSCNPATQARDLALLKDLYDITHVQPVDMFPHTSHVENVVCLERKIG